MTPWKEKANRIIGELSREAYLKANRKPDGTMRKKHVPYTIPDTARCLVNCLDRNDEITAKTIFQRLAVVGQ